MKKLIEQKIEIPEGVEVKIEDGLVSVKGPAGENGREFKIHKIELKKDGKEILIKCTKATKTEKKMINTIASHIKNMVNGVLDKFEYQLKICSSHFPITVKIEGQKVLIKNFLGEKIDRSCKIPLGAEVEIQKELIIVKSVDKEIAGQAAANFEKATKVRGRDRRVFQDGIYIIKKPKGKI